MLLTCNNIFRSLFLVLIVISLLMLNVALAAEPLSMSEAITLVKKRSGGEVLAAKKNINRNGKAVYHIKVLTKKGVVRKVRIKAER